MNIRSLLDRFYKVSRRLSSIFYVDTSMANWPQTMRDYDTIAQEGYQQCTEVYACINLLAHTAKGVKWLVYRKPQKGKKLIEIEDRNHPYVKLLTRPNPYQGWGKFIENLVGYYRLAGNAYIYRVGPGKNGPPTELWLLRPDRVAPVPSTNPAYPIARYDYSINNKTTPLIPDRTIITTPWHVVKHFKQFNPTDDIYGLSPITAGGKVIDQMNEAAKLNYGLLKNGARMSGAFISKGSYDEDMEATLRRQLDEKYAGSQNAGKQLLLTGDLDWKEMGIKPKDMDWLQGQQMNTRRICSLFQISPELIGDAQNKTYNNQKEARRALYVEAVLPLLDEFEDEFNSWLSPLFGDDYYIGYDRDDIEAIRDERSEVWAKMLSAVNSGVITPNEGRAAIGYEAVDPKSDPEKTADKLRVLPAKPGLTPASINETLDAQPK